MEGGQTMGVLMNRTKIDWCLPSVIQCESALAEIAKLYTNGDKELGLSRHYIPLYRGRRSWQKHQGEMSKVLKRISSASPTAIPFVRKLHMSKHYSFEIIVSNYWILVALLLRLVI